jgi:lysozyme
MNDLLDGIDVSSAQGNVQWNVVKNTNYLSFAFCKVTEGTGHIDPQFKNNWAGIKKCGIIRGAYAFARNQNSAILEADHFANTILSTGDLNSGDIMMLDIETSSLSGNAFTDWILVWCDRVKQKTNITPIIYTGKYFFEQYSNGADQASLTKISQYPLFLAAYVNSPKAYIPAPWVNKGWRFWQRSGDQAASGDSILHLPGINGNIDHDQFMGSLADLQAFAASLYQAPAVSTPPPVQSILSIPAADPSEVVPPGVNNDPDTVGLFSGIANFFSNLFKK